MLRTLRGQLFLGVVSIFVVIYLGLFWVNMQSTRAYVESQLASHAQDAATSLTFPLSRALGEKDVVLADTYVSAMFDRGYFSSITVFDPNGKVLLTRSLPAAQPGVPDWFVRMVKIQTAPGGSLLSSGWRQLGRVVVVSQPSLAYQELWQSSTKAGLWLISVLCVSILLARLLLGKILSPLYAIEAAAEAVSSRRFDAILLAPATRELSRVVVAMNAMIGKIRGYLDQEIGKAEQYRQEAYHDAVTSLDNRRSLDLRFAELLADDGSFLSGALVAIHLDDLKDYNLKAGYQGGDALLSALAEVLRTIMGDRARIMARMNGGTLAALVLDVPEIELEHSVRLLQHAVKDVLQQKDYMQAHAIGVAAFSAGESRGAIMARLDMALAAVQHFHGDSVQFRRAADGAGLETGSTAWKLLLQDALDNKGWVLFRQPVRSVGGEGVIHYEVFARMVGHGEDLISAGQFLPMARRHGVLVEVEHALLEIIQRRLQSRDEDVAIAINISLDGLLADAEGRGRLEKLIDSLPATRRRRLALELSEFQMVRMRSDDIRFIRAMREQGCQLGIDQFGYDANALSAIRDLVPDYIKLDGGLIREVAATSSNREYIDALAKLCGSLGVQFIAQGIETEAMVALVGDLGANGVQGYWVGKPAAWL
ncbi:EAL domain-containing protein [Burkholderiaceae bacterium DAT-1]|nr:EAL domain-containing protein [Burkholderiaceae bacterium DAT-1]